MQTLLLHALMLLAFTICGFATLPAPAFANTQAPVPLVAPPAPKPAPAADDFTDQDFDQADQAELGDRQGGDAGIGLLIFILVVVLIVLLIYYLIDHGRL